METIIVGFSKPKKWEPFSWLIMKAYSIPYDHVYIKIHLDKFQRNVIYQASKIMVNFMGESIFLSDNQIIKEFEVQVSSENLTKLVQFAIDNAGKPYGILEALGMGIVRVADLLGKKIKNPFRDKTNTYVCSELAGFILEQYAEANFSEDIDDITPLDVYNYLSRLQKSNEKKES